LLRAAPRPPVPIPVAHWARAYGLARDPAIGRHAIALIGPGPDFNPEYAMTTDPDDPVILATLTGSGGQPAPLLIDGCHRLYKAAVTGRAEIPAFVLTAAETLLIRSDAVLGPARPARPPGTAQPSHHPNGGDPDADRNHHENQHPARRRRAVARRKRPPVLAYLTGTLGMTDADARDLLKAARAAQAETGPGALAHCPVRAGTLTC
jgi:hypothetical protein